LGGAWKVKAEEDCHSDSRALSSHRIVVVRGHGSFAIGQNLKEAFNLTTALEESCQVNWLSRSLGYSSP